MGWVPLKNGSGQVVKDIKLKAPAGATVKKGNDKITLQKSKTSGVRPSRDARSAPVPRMPVRALCAPELGPSSGMMLTV